MHYREKDLRAFLVGISEDDKEKIKSWGSKKRERFNELVKKGYSYSDSYEAVEYNNGDEPVGVLKSKEVFGDITEKYSMEDNGDIQEADRKEGEAEEESSQEAEAGDELEDNPTDNSSDT